MMKKFIGGFSILILISSCSGKEEKKLLIEKKKKESKEYRERDVKYWNDIFYEEQAQYKKDSLCAGSESENKDGEVETIFGDYNGDGKLECVFISPKSGYITFFPDNLGNVSVLGKLNPKYSKIINEGDLNNDGAEDFSVYTDFGNFGTIDTFMYDRDFPWRVSLQINIKKGEKVSDEDLKNRVFRKNNQIYYYENEQHIKDRNMPEDTNRKNKLIKKSFKDYKSII